MYSCEWVPVKLPPVTMCGKGIFYTGDCICADGKLPVVIAKNSLWQQAYSCDPIVTTPPVCTKEYAPVCAQPKANCNKPGTACTDMMSSPQTYGNKCMMEGEWAGYLYAGVCNTTELPWVPSCASGVFTNPSCICKDGTSPRSLPSGTRIQMYSCDPIVTTPPVCTKEYAPVCGQFTPVCTKGMACLMAYPMPTTYTNMCELTKARATFISTGACTSDI